MKVYAFVFLAIAACAVALPPRSSLRPDLYKDTLTSNSRIIGGQEAERHQFPHQASIRMGTLGVFMHVCGGTLISESWVLTAGHCKGSKLASYEVALGMLNQKEDHDDVQIIKVKRFIVHPKYPGGVASNDIALIELETPAKLTEAVQIAPLPKGLSECAIIDDVYLSGWGMTSSWLPVTPAALHWINLPRISNEDCGNHLTEILGGPEPLDDTMICTGQREGQKQSACSGDSGGPLVLKSDNTIVGVVSWGITPCGTKGAPSVYSSVCSHLDFIHLYI